MKEFKIRCSAIGEIMTDGKNAAGLTVIQEKKYQELLKKEKRTEKQTSEMDGLYHKKNKPPELSATAKTHCQNWLREQLYSRRKDISNKYCDKGNAVEDESIRLLNAILLTDYEKNEEYKENEYMTGTCDIKGDLHIRDMKNSWDCYTFPLFDTGIKDAGYKWQLQGYMELYDKDYACLDYMLMDAPLHIIINEAKSKAYKEGLDYDAIFPEVHKLMTFGDIDNKLRHKSFPIDRDRQAIQKVYDRVKLCRVYINELNERMK